MVVARDGQQGVDIALREKPDLVLMDLSLPKLDGFGALAELRKDESTRAIPVIAFTASVMPQDRNDIIAAGFDAFVSKPINIEAFLAAVREALGKRRPGEAS